MEKFYNFLKSCKWSNFHSHKNQFLFLYKNYFIYFYIFYIIFIKFLYVLQFYISNDWFLFFTQLYIWKDKPLAITVGTIIVRVIMHVEIYIQTV